MSEGCSLYLLLSHREDPRRANTVQHAYDNTTLRNGAPLRYECCRWIPQSSERLQPVTKEGCKASAEFTPVATPAVQHLGTYHLTQRVAPASRIDRGERAHQSLPYYCTAPHASTSLRDRKPTFSPHRVGLCTLIACSRRARGEGRPRGRIPPRGIAANKREERRGVALFAAVRAARACRWAAELLYG